MKIMFMGTPEISATCLKKLIDDGHDICAVVTREDKPRGRGNVMTPTPTKLVAIEHGIDALTPSTLRDDAFAAVLEKYSPDLIAVVAYGKILPESVLSFPKYGCINLHVSCLPKYRGAAPMQRAIMDGERETGVTVMHMDVGLDTGDIIDMLKFPIESEDDFEAIHDKSAELGSELLSKTIVKIFDGTATRTKQDDSLATYAKKIEKDNCKLDFTNSAQKLDFTIRGVTPIPGAFAYLGGKMLKINKARPIKYSGGACGEVVALDDKGTGSFTVACGEGSVSLLTVLPEGKKRMAAADFINGRKIAVGDALK